MRARWIVLVALVACGRDKGAGTDVGARPSVDAGFVASPAGAAGGASAPRPYVLHPPSPTPSGPVPLVLFFHGYGATASEQASEFGLEALADAHGFALAYTDGTPDSRGKRFWNATDACCNFDGASLDDVAYVRWLVGDVERRVPVDRSRVYAVGFSNGGFLAHRLACDLAPTFAAVVSLAGAAWNDASRCAPSEPVSVLEIHGDADRVVRPEGGLVFGIPGRRYPSLAQTLATWAAKDACAGTLAPTGRRIDFDRALPGAESEEATYAGCPAGVDVTWWSVKGEGHLGNPGTAGMEAVWEWMRGHTKRRGD
jgi:polyhydroxybutyrate depolymerase